MLTPTLLKLEDIKILFPLSPDLRKSFLPLLNYQKDHKFLLDGIEVEGRIK
jgi:hypothetical protein